MLCAPTDAGADCGADCASLSRLLLSGLTFTYAAQSLSLSLSYCFTLSISFFCSFLQLILLQSFPTSATLRMRNLATYAPCFPYSISLSPLYLYISLSPALTALTSSLVCPLPPHCVCVICSLMPPSVPVSPFSITLCNSFSFFSLSRLLFSLFYRHSAYA